MNAKALCGAVALIGVVSCDRKTEESSSVNKRPGMHRESIPPKSATLPRATNTTPVVGADPLEAPQKADALAHRESQLALAASGKTVSMVGLARAKNLEQIEKAIRPTGESKVLRHAATKENVLKLLGNIDPHQLKIGQIQFSSAQSLVHVRIEEPVRLDLEFYFDGTSEDQLRLQSIHP